MRTYDPADGILYVHLSQDGAAPPAPPHAQDGCHRLPSGYANASLRSRLGEPRVDRARPALVLLPGGSAPASASAPADGPAPGPAGSALRLAR